MNSKAKKLYSKIKPGDLIEYGYEVWHIAEPEKKDRTRNLMHVINGTCLDSNHSTISGLILQYSVGSVYGILLSDIINEYTVRNKKHEGERGYWRYRKPYIRIVPNHERVLMDIPIK